MLAKSLNNIQLPINYSFQKKTGNPKYITIGSGTVTLAIP